MGIGNMIVMKWLDISRPHRVSQGDTETRADRNVLPRATT